MTTSALFHPMVQSSFLKVLIKSCSVSLFRFLLSLIVVYQSERRLEDGEVNMLDFTKGKADEGESDVDCAVREINEEVGFNVRPYINEDHFIKVETIQGKFVKLFLVRDIDESNSSIVLSTQRTMRKKTTNQLKRFQEAQKVVWIETKRYLQQSLRSGVEN